MEFNSEQIIKALECCTSEYSKCKDCPRYGFVSCTQPLLTDALALIKELTAKTEAQDIVIAEERKKRQKAEHDAARYEQKIKELIEKLAEENERLRGIGIPDDETYIKLSDAKHAIMNYVGEQTVSKYASSEICKAVRNGAEGAMNELDYITPANVAPKADTVRKMQERFNEKVANLLMSPALQYQASAFIDEIAKEMLEEI